MYDHLHRLFLPTLLIIAGLAPLAPAFAQAPGPIVLAAVSDTGSDQSGAGFILRNGERCVLLTAAHVVREAIDVTVAAVDQPPVTTSDKLLGPRDLDVALMPITRAPETCPTPPSESDIRRAVQEGQGNLLVALKGGQSVSVPILAVKVSDDHIDVRPASTMFPIQAGMSGAVLVMGGVPVAILSNTETKEDRTASAVRLDYAARVLGPRVINLTVVVVQGGDAVLRANEVLRHAIESRPSSDMGQVEALQSLSAAGKGASGLDLQGISFAKADVTNLEAADTNFNLADLTQARFASSNLPDVDMSFATLLAAHFPSSKLDNVLASFAQGPQADFAKASLRQATFIGANLNGASFRGAVLDGASFAFADLRGADFRGATFDHLVLAGADLRGAHFDQGSSVGSLDVTAALFSDDTFPAALAPRLCASPSSGNVAVEVMEERKSASSDSGFAYENIARWQSPLALPSTINRYFPACPRRFGKIGSYRRSMVDTFNPKLSDFDIVRGWDKGLPTERIAASLRANVSSELIDTAGRRKRVRAVVQEFIDSYNARFALLTNSNAIYRGREARILAAVTRMAKAVPAPATIRVTREVQHLIEAKVGLDHSIPEWLPRERLEREKMLRRKYPGHEARYDSWPAFFPPDTEADDITGEVKAQALQWSAARMAALPAKLEFSSFVDPETYGVFRPTTVDAMMAPYDQAPSAERDRLQALRNQACDRLIATQWSKADEAEHARLASQLGYNGVNVFICREMKWEAKREAVFQASWYNPDKSLLLYGDRFLLVFDGPVPTILSENHRANEPHPVLVANVERMFMFPPVPGKPDAERPIVLLLRSASFRMEMFAP